MDAEAVLIIGGVVGTLSKVAFQGGVSGRWATLAALVIATVCVAVWGYSHGDFTRENTWGYFAGWAAVLATAAGFFHGIEEVPKTATFQKMTGTGDGTPK